MRGEDEAAGSGGGSASGIPESLYGRLSMKDMGSRADREAAPVLKKKPNGDLVDAVPTTLYGGYRPKTKESKEAFEYITGLAGKLLGGDQPHDVIMSATDAVLIALKTPDVSDAWRRVELEKVFGVAALEKESFDQFMNLAKHISDYSIESGVGAVDAEDDCGVAVVFEEEEEDGEEFLAEEQVDEDETYDLINGSVAPIEPEEGEVFITERYKYVCCALFNTVL